MSELTNDSVLAPRLAKVLTPIVDFDRETGTNINNCFSFLVLDS